MDYKVKKGEEEARVFLHGSIDIPGAERLKSILKQILNEKFKAVVIDFEEVEFIGSSGIGKLLLFYKNSKSIGCEIKLVNLNSEIKTLFKHIGLDEVFNL